MAGIRFVQFPHPGGEHRPDVNRQRKPWNPLKTRTGKDNPHARTFFQVNGKRIADGQILKGPLWAWGEWEAEARVVRELRYSEGEPRTLFEPYWIPKQNFAGLHNTDPFVFGGFYYTDCKQGTSPSLIGLRELDIGSVIVFGSRTSDASGEPVWFLDTVFVVGDFSDHNASNYREVILDKVPPGYEQVALGPTYASQAANRSLPRRMYFGATHDKPVNGMFSFFPCRGPGTDKGFARPQLRNSDILNEALFEPKLRRGAKGHSRTAPPMSLSSITPIWEEVVKQVTEAGCHLGIEAEMPSRQDPKAIEG